MQSAEFLWKHRRNSSLLDTYTVYIHCIHTKHTCIDGWTNRWTDRQMDTIVYMLYILCTNMYTQHEYAIQYLDTNRVYMLSIHTKHTWTDGWMDRWMDKFR